MADPKKPKKSEPKKSSPPPGGPPAPAGPPMADPMMAGAGIPPPNPGEGIDPYAALAGLISQGAPAGPPGMGPPGMGGPPGMEMPMGAGPGGSVMGGGGPGGGMGMGLAGPGAEAPPPGGDPIMNALMASASPLSFPEAPDEDALGEMNQPQMSIQQLLTLLSLMQGGIPSSGLAPPSRPGSVTAGVIPGSLGV